MSKTDAPEVRRLGRKHLGRHANETQMPARISSLIKTQDLTPANTHESILPVLQTLLIASAKTTSAILCTGPVSQIHRLSSEGQHFCAYRNMQMLLSSLSSPNPSSQSEDPLATARKANVLTLQNLIEAAWTSGINAHSRIETGGIANTRKHVGTSEAEALFTYLHIPTVAKVFTGSDAWRELLDYVTQYFSTTDDGAKVRSVKRGPIFLQRPKHSLTIVGIEVREKGRGLLCFDPGYDLSGTMRRVVSAGETEREKIVKGIKGEKAKRVLRYYRRNERYLKRYRGFEILHFKDGDTQI